MTQHRHRRERWLHARISEDLEQALKREARRRRSPVSLVVRNVLEGALDLVEEIVGDSIEIAQHSRRWVRRVGHSGDEDGESPLETIYGWQELILNRAASCARCRAGLEAGATAYRGLRDGAGPPVFLCVACVRALRPAGPNQEENP